MNNKERQTQIQLALSQARRVEREARDTVRQLARLRDNSMSEEEQEENEHRDD